MAMTHRALADLDAGINTIRAAPRDAGTVALIVRRPAEDRREVLTAGQLDPDRGLIGDTWTRGDRHGADDQLTLMNSRVVDLLAGDRERWPLAGDQIYVDFDLSEEALTAGTRLAVGEAVIEITPLPHKGCSKFAERFGHDGLRFVNTPQGRSLRLRGVYARVVTAGVVRPGDAIRRMP
jgi:MOSC domain-containing protein YiiM